MINSNNRLNLLAVSVSDIESLHELFKKLSNSVVKDELIHKVRLLLSIIDIFQSVLEVFILSLLST